VPRLLILHGTVVYQAGAIMVELDLTQTNTENGTIRRVRRLEEAER
jgi:hypothetical protein